MHVALDGVRITTPDIDAEGAVVAVATTVENDTRHTRTTVIAWRSPAPTARSRRDVGARHRPARRDASSARARCRRGPELWSAERPASTTCTRDLDRGRRSRDRRRMPTPFGIRRLQLDPQHGLRINGETVKLRGACIHHDNGLLGAATIARAEERRIDCSRRPGSTPSAARTTRSAPRMLDACDRLGMLVMDETDVWTESKTAFDYSLDVPRVVGARRRGDGREGLQPPERDHVLDRQRDPRDRDPGRRRPGARSLAEKVRALDDTRFVTNGINGIVATSIAMAETMAEAAQAIRREHDDGRHRRDDGAHERVDARHRATEESAAVLDVVGMNYADSRYELDGELFPHRVIVGTETFPSTIDTMWRSSRLPHVIGDFTWTGWDYLGEAGIGRVDYTDARATSPTGRRTLPLAARLVR